ncbi:hypothetical protein BH11MYX4_BH11MYX4_10760 [soil metagenome]
MRTVLSIAVGIALALVAPAALAQDTPPPPAGDGTLPPPKVVTKTTVETGPAGAKKAEDDDPTSDHEKVVGHFGVGYLGLTNIPIGTGGAVATAAVPRGNVAAPVIGVRYWLTEKLGLDLGIGLGITGGSQEQVTGNNTNSQDQAGVFGLAFHGGVPLVLGHQKHYKFLLIPELNIGFATQTETPANPTGAPTTAGDISRTGFHLDLGARIGTEIHFGFIGVPQLSLQATVGLLARRDAWKVKQDVGNQTNSASVGETAFGTTVQGEPWAIFVNNISAIYYLP